ncbi:hypothetical protein M422DRAFT_38396 [Sphaerobolus stellatus SS14]|uniref:Uncharacterized protein n=1 Tax=Sphaerobolus stellatus (strain SS14) TaxID=990650 RepID=A0A0C9UKN1_SPHS4|nr:hypothetical protein M422DRAFT_38396 [Sphaerobolus stellatus SS14]
MDKRKAYHSSNRPMYNPLHQLIETQADNIAEIVFREAVEDDLGVETVDELGWAVVPCDVEDGRFGGGSDIAIGSDRGG